MKRTKLEIEILKYKCPVALDFKKNDQIRFFYHCRHCHCHSFCRHLIILWNFRSFASHRHCSRLIRRRQNNIYNNNNNNSINFNCHQMFITILQIE
ncbi:hypothetical protein DERP_012956 [Dermatophagoides pteronyssinus]|uniref:Uncharacterized protein n=1 Tax=Dermatophagoides pteronyssinus TaxID=6956 RepID=A0ABQ8IST0_DERPT|nr:hypothetical protein DERP_012956 [Dermatophagoides pteronyssinus]